MKYIGIDGCKAGWFIVGLNEDGSSTFQVLSQIKELSEYLSAAELVLLDIPIGLRGWHKDERLCDKKARAVLQPKRGSSVFPAPSRCALECLSYEEASERNRVCTGRKLTKQTYAIIPKIREVDTYLSGERRRNKIHEMHPEVCFWSLNGQQPMNYKKKSVEGYEERIAVLTKYYKKSREVAEVAMQQHARADVARDDIVDALVGAVTAINSRKLLRFPETPEIDDMGLPMEIVYK